MQFNGILLASIEVNIQNMIIYHNWTHIFELVENLRMDTTKISVLKRIGLCAQYSLSVLSSIVITIEGHLY